MLLFDKIVFLNRVPLFSELAADEIHLVAAIAEVESYGADDLMFGEGEPGDRLCLIVSGEVEVVKDLAGDARVLSTLCEGSSLGEMALFDDQPRSASARCVANCTVLSISKPAITELIHRHPAIAVAIIRSMSLRLRQMIAAGGSG
jgi:CRP-like cAMP-binding protein